MKRILSLLLALVFVLALSPAVSADVIFQPEDNFYAKHHEECEYLDRVYLTSGPNGSVTVYKSPESASVVQTLDNGTQLWISYVYPDKDGIFWGFCEYHGKGHWAGWIPMDYLLLKYDSIAFREEFADRIEKNGGEVQADGVVHFWSYPGSDTLSADIAVQKEDHLPQYDLLFTDDAGRKWGHVNYYMGIRDVWVCLDDPTVDYDTLYKNAAPQAVTHPQKPDIGTTEEIKPGGIGMETVLTAAAAVAAFSAGFLWFTRKKK